MFCIQIVEVAHYSHYGLAAYSTLMYLYVNPCTGMCRLCCCSPSLKFKIGGGNQSCCCCCARCASFLATFMGEMFGLLFLHRKGNGLIVGDNPCALHESAVLKVLLPLFVISLQITKAGLMCVRWPIWISQSLSMPTSRMISPYGPTPSSLTSRSMYAELSCLILHLRQNSIPCFIICRVTDSGGNDSRNLVIRRLCD